MSISKDKILSALPSEYGFEVKVFDTADSTNNAAKRECSYTPTLVAAAAQTLGRGRHGKSFFSPTGGIYMSLVLPKADFFELATVRAAVAVCRVIERFSPDKTEIKWVNDIFSDGRKVSGILCELVEDTVIIGIGININRNEFPDEISDTAGAVKLENTDRETVIASIAAEIMSLSELCAEKLLAEYKSRLFILGKTLEYTADGKKHSGVAVDINGQGNLIVRENGIFRTLNSGEISLGSKSFAAKE